MRRIQIFIITFCFLISAQGNGQAKTAAGEKNLDEQRELKAARDERIEEFERFEAENDLDRELTKKRNALWKKEQARLTQEFRKRRTERLSQIDAEKAKEMASRARQKEIHAQMELEESENKAKLVKRKMEILYGKADSSDSEVEEDLVESGAQKKPFWEKWLEPLEPKK